VARTATGRSGFGCENANFTVMIPLRAVQIEIGFACDHGLASVPFSGYSIKTMWYSW
jgi:hypothetical protein